MAAALDDDPEPFRPDAGVDDGTMDSPRRKVVGCGHIRAKAPARTSWGGRSWAISTRTASLFRVRIAPFIWAG